MVYSPTKEEVNEVIQAALDDNTPPTDVYNAIQKENPNWKLSHRKVAKYVKRQVKAKNAPLSPTHEDGHDDDDTSVGSMSSRARNVLKAVSTRTLGKGKHHDDTSLASSPSVSDKIKSKFKGFRRKKGVNAGIPSTIPESINTMPAPETPVKKVEYSTLDMSPLLTEPDSAGTADTSKATTDSAGQHIVDEGSPNAVSKNLEKKMEETAEEKAEAYTDDNDGKKEECCAQGCVIL